MSELKAVHAFDVYEAYTKTGDDDAAQFYLKSEADKVIAELEESHKMEVEQLLLEIVKLKEERRWRKFPDKKPEEWETVVVRLSNGFYDLAVYLSNGQGWDIGDGAYHKPEEVTHWMPLPSAPKDEKMIEPGKLNGYLVAIKEELRKAEGKHPDFCDVLTTQELEFAFKGELFYKKINSSAPYVGDKILLEEFYESIHSYLQGDKVHAIEELAQCGAVIIRMMDFVSKEIEDENADKV